MTPRPFADAALDLFRAGWHPVPVDAGQKKYPEDGRTGAGGVDLSMADVYQRTQERPSANVAIRAPEGVIGIDVDDYDAKTGGQTLAELEAELGPLPATWMTTSRQGVSGIRWFQVPTGRRWRERGLGSIELIHRTHRYGMMPPSIHPEGRTYRWVAPDGATAAAPPKVGTLPQLPARWVERLSVTGSPSVATDDATDEEVATWRAQFRTGDPCSDVADAIANHAQDVLKAAHPPTMDTVSDLTYYGFIGHRGASEALDAVRDQFHAALLRRGTRHDRRRADGDEWQQMLRHAFGKKQDTVGSVAAACTCPTVLETPELSDPPEADSQDDELPSPAVLEFQTIGAMAAEVDAAGQAEWMLRRIWPQGDYGVHGAEEKAQKSWNTFDLAVSVASGTPWLGHVPVDVSGPVVMFVGEGSKRNTVRRLRGIADERGVLLEELPIYVCVRAPNLASEVHLQEFEDVVADVRPTLVTLDPLYLAAQGADGGNIYGMGAVLQRGQHICQRHGASLWVVHHNNRTGRKGGRALSGAGPAEWGRVLLTAEVKSRRTDPETQETDVTTELAVIGGEVADQKLRVRRRIHAEDPDDLSSLFHIVTETTDADTPRTTSGGPEADLPPGAIGLLEAAKTDPERGWTLRTLNDKKGDLDGIYLKRETASRYLNQMERAGLIGGDDPEPFEEKVWWLSARVTSRDVVEDHATETPKSSRDARDVTRDDHTGGGANPRVTSPNPLGDVTRDASTTPASQPDGKEAA